MNFQSMIQAIKSAIDLRTKTPATAISNVILLCGLMRRPGLSVIVSMTKIAELLQLKGIPTEPAPDGTPNLTLVHDYILVNEIYRALREDSKISIVMKPGEISFMGTGANSGGPVTVNGYNVNVPGGSGCIQ